MILYILLRAYKYVKVHSYCYICGPAPIAGPTWVPTQNESLHNMGPYTTWVSTQNGSYPILVSTQYKILHNIRYYT